MIFVYTKCLKILCLYQSVENCFEIDLQTFYTKLTWLNDITKTNYCIY